MATLQTQEVGHQSLFRLGLENLSKVRVDAHLIMFEIIWTILHHLKFYKPLQPFDSA